MSTFTFPFEPGALLTFLCVSWNHHNECWSHGWTFGRNVGDDLKDEADIKVVITAVFCMVCATHSIVQLTSLFLRDTEPLAANARQPPTCPSASRQFPEGPIMPRALSPSNTKAWLSQSALSSAWPLPLALHSQLPLSSWL